jgi:uncharacterized protein YndB with AHSA1/START domain
VLRLTMSIGRGWTLRFVQKWLSPGDAEVTRVEIDERVGGHYRTWTSHDGQPTGGWDSELPKLVPDQRIFWRWGFIGPQRREAEAFDTRLEVRLREDEPGTTTLVLVHDQLEELASAMPEVAGKLDAGWEGTLEKLDAQLSSADQRRSVGGSDA